MALARIFVFLLALTHVVGLAELVVTDACDEVCADDDCGADCMPGAACRCHCPSAASLRSEVTVPQLRTQDDALDVAAAGERLDRVHASPDPLEILHVPRRSV